jgi:hypothetical protein
METVTLTEHKRVIQQLIEDRQETQIRAALVHITRMHAHSYLAIDAVHDGDAATARLHAHLAVTEARQIRP